MSGLRFQWTGLTRISGRERRTLMVGMTATVLIIAGAMGTRGAQTWSSYTDALNLKRQRAGRLETSARARPQVTAHLSSARAALLPYRVRLLRGATAEVAAASLQQHVQAIASIAQLQVGRVDVERADSVHTSRLRAIRVVVNAQGDVYGLASFL
ncbi:MAG TPA: GspMb/PilO family protein, partial [Longimicrobiales bacterium]